MANGIRRKTELCATGPVQEDAPSGPPGLAAQTDQGAARGHTLPLKPHVRGSSATHRCPDSTDGIRVLPLVYRRLRSVLSSHGGPFGCV